MGSNIVGRPDISLAGRLLVATPSISKDSFFNKAVIYLLSHNNNGAIGLVVNHAVGNVNCSVLFSSFKIEQSDSSNNMPIYIGGPVEAEKGFILHTNDYESESLFRSEGDGIAVSSNIQILKDIAIGQGPQKSIFVLGYAGWQTGQLESEIASNNWLVVPFSKDVIFAPNDASKWDLAINIIGIKSYTLSAESGHA